MLRSMLVLGAAAVALAACGSDEAEKAAKDAANAAANAANTAADTAANTANAAANAANTVEGAEDGSPPDDTNAGKGKGWGKTGKAPTIKLNLKKVGFVGCTRLVKVSKPGGCMVVKSGTVTYEIDSAKPRPDPNRAIAGTGLYLPNAKGICMAGKPLTGVKWSYTKGHCAKGKG